MNKKSKEKKDKNLKKESKGKVNKVGKSWRPFDEAREFARGLGLKNRAEWFKYCRGEMPWLPKKPDDIPTRPDIVYRNEK